ncbi:MAG: GNAT family N-acetyltransferase [Treponema sp.]|nr:GNAT family N-acetyltransferase [Candidatus Treponema caballi]
MFVRELTPDTLEEAAAFIGLHEERSIALMSHLTDGTKLRMPEDQFVYYLFRRSRKEHIVAVVCLSENGLVLHHIGDEVYADEELRTSIARDLLGALRQIPLYCILGEERGSEFIRNCTKKKSRAAIHYQLMTWNGVPQPETQMKPGVSSPAPVPAGFTLTRCTEDDTEALLPLQKEYDLVEVLQPGDEWNEDFSRLTLRKNLRTQHIIGLKADAQFAAKAGTNAIGLKWWQLGGVYTRPEFRNRGCAAFLVEQLARLAGAEGKRTALFVKEANTSAKAAYTKAHFIPLGPFEIIYY